MREITTVLDAKISAELSQICRQTKTAAAWSEADFLNEYSQTCSKIFVLADIQNNQKITLGFCACRFVFENAEITNFALSPKYQRKHLGSELFNYALDFLRNSGVKDVTLEVSSANIAAQKFYKKFNFVCVSIRKKFYNMGEDALLLKLNL